MRDTTQYIEIKGRKFALNKFDPFFGNFIAFRLLSLQPKKGSDLPLENLIQSFMEGNYEEYEKFTKKVLRYCSEVLPSGEVPIINSENNIAITGLDAPLMMELFTREMIFNLEGFFGEDTEAQNQMEKREDSILTNKQ